MQTEVVASRGRGRPRSTDRDVQIRETAWKLIAEYGCEGLTFEAIAQAVGCSRSTLYRRFPSKADLLKLLLLEAARAVAPVILPGTDPRAALFAHACSCAELMFGDRGTAILNISSAARRDTSIGEALDSHQALVAPHYRTPLRELVASATDAELDFASGTLIGSIIHHVATRRVQLSSEQLRALVEQAIFLAGAQASERA